MKRGGLRRLMIRTTVTLVACIALYLLVVRPWHLTWGATREEVARPMPGDDIHPHPSLDGTRAVSVHARPEHIWPWLVQMGYRRAGFYSYDRLDNAGIPSSDSILPQYQDLKVGDRIPMSPDAYVEVEEMDPERSMLWVFRGEGQWENATWAWGLYEKDEGLTRLVSRLRVSYKWTRPSIIPMLFVDMVELVMMRKCLLGIRERAERLAREGA
jgi:hypothetical protein